MHHTQSEGEQGSLGDALPAPDEGGADVGWVAAGFHAAGG